MFDFLAQNSGLLFLAGFAAGFLIAAMVRFVASIVKTAKRIMSGR